jgi:hypothetical protein
MAEPKATIGRTIADSTPCWPTRAVRRRAHPTSWWCCSSQRTITLFIDGKAAGAAMDADQLLDGHAIGEAEMARQ